MEASTRPRAASRASGDASQATTGRPARAVTSTMPLPMVPTPTTPTASNDIFPSPSEGPPNWRDGILW